ncbi:hypothetical protein EH165_02530 [Nakamurella antarctica]|uniref:Uncharacterized protein n=1 Tax=Nakamurella antarctica TaxID=1902245 RepID=A0A3G8ZIK8_9ACTN|nr:hypothetical protein [Nakamurella antarctica]AZI57199.1 hypothetical protein EH165_02530 [Nakamurella antarctica]
MNSSQNQPTQSVSPGADPYEMKYEGQSNPFMINPLNAAAAEFESGPASVPVESPRDEDRPK